MPQAVKTKIFLSYSRKDGKFVDRLERQLRGAGYDVLIDRKDIAAAEIWRRRLDAMIVNSDAVVFVITPDSVRSVECAREVERVAELGKRLVPLLLEDIGKLECPVELNAPNWVHAKRGRFGAALDKKCFAQVRAALDGDIEWVREHARLTALAERWRATNAEDRLLHGQEVAAAVSWRDKGATGDMTVPPLLDEFIDTSVENERAEALAEKRESFRYSLSMSDALSEKAARHMRDHQLLQANCLLAAAYLQNPLVADRAAFLSLAEEVDAERARRLARTQSSDLIDLERRIPIEHVDRIRVGKKRGNDLYYDRAGGQLLVSSFRDLSRWDFGARKWMESPIPEPAPAGVFLPGREIAAIGEDSAIVVRDMDSGVERLRVAAPAEISKAYITGIAFSHDGRYVAVIGDALYVVDRTDGSLDVFKGDEPYFRPYSLTPVVLDGETCFALGLAGEIGVYSCDKRGYIHKLRCGPSLTLNAIMYDATTDCFYAGGTAEDIFAVRADGSVEVVGHHEDRVTSLTPLQGQRAYISTGWDGGAFLRSLDDDSIEIAVPSQVTMDDPGIASSAASEDGEQFAVLEDSGNIDIWRRRHAPHDARLEHANTILSIAPDPSDPGRVAVAGFVGPGAAIWNAADEGWVRTELPIEAPMRDAAYSGDGRVLAISGDAPEIALFGPGGTPIGALRVAGEFVSEDPMKKMDARQDMITCVTLSADGARAAWSAPGGAIQIGEVESGAVRVLVAPGRETFERVVFAPSGEALYAATSDGKLFEVALDGAMQLRCGDIPQASTFGKGPAIAVSRDGEYVAVSGEGNTIRILGRDGEPELVIEGHREKFKRGWSESVAGLAFSPDRRMLVSTGSRQSGGKDPRTVRLWDVETGEQIWRRLVNADSLAAEFSSDGRRLFIAVGDEIQVVELGEISISLSPAERLAKAEEMLGAKWTSLF